MEINLGSEIQSASSSVAPNENIVKFDMVRVPMEPCGAETPTAWRQPFTVSRLLTATNYAAERKVDGTRQSM